MLHFPIRSSIIELKHAIFQLVTQAYILGKKEIPSAPNRSKTYDLLISTSDALPLSDRRLLVASAGAEPLMRAQQGILDSSVLCKDLFGSFEIRDNVSYE